MPLPAKSGLYDPQHEHDACGVGFVANIRGERSHAIVEQGVDILLNLVHRGASGCDPLTGDGAGILVQIPHELLAHECDNLQLPEPGRYGVGSVFLPRDRTQRARLKQIIEDKIAGTGQRLIGWRALPVNEDVLGPVARASAPVIEQVLVGSSCEDEVTFESQAVRDPQVGGAHGARERPRRRGHSSTCRACRRGRSSTRACFWRSSSPASIRI